MMFVLSDLDSGPADASNARPALQLVPASALRADFAGQLIEPTDAEYEDARQIWNAMIDKRPALIARASGVADVVAVVKLARRHALPLAVRCGGHNVAGLGSSDGGIVLDLSLMRTATPDPDQQRVVAQGGCLLGDVDRATQAFGMSTPAGVVSHTGAGGLTLGGGTGWLSRKYGLTIDNLISAQVVTADGQVLRATEDGEHSELLWGLKGGGGNFGVVTEFEYRCHPVSNVLFGTLFYDAADAPAALRFHRDFMESAAPDDLQTLAALQLAPRQPWIPAALHGRPVIKFYLVWSGEPIVGQRVMRPLLEFGSPIAVQPLQPTPFLELQRLNDQVQAHGFQNYTKGTALRTLHDAAIDVLVEQGRQIASPLSAIEIQYLQGAVSRVPEDATAFSDRSVAYIVNILGTWLDPLAADIHVPWVRATQRAIEPWTTGGAYVNFLMNDDKLDRVIATYGESKYARLVALKDAYDPTNLFRINQNIRPSAR